MSNWNFPLPGIGNVGSYLTSGDPFVKTLGITGSGTNGGEIHVQFPRVTRALTIVNKSTYGLYIHFASRSNASVLANQCVAVLENSGDAWAFNCRCKEVYISATGSSGVGSVTISAELTNIPREEMYTLSGSGINVA